MCQIVPLVVQALSTPLEKLGFEKWAVRGGQKTNPTRNAAFARTAASVQRNSGSHPGRQAVGEGRMF